MDDFKEIFGNMSKRTAFNIYLNDLLDIASMVSKLKSLGSDVKEEYRHFSYALSTIATAKVPKTGIDGQTLFVLEFLYNFLIEANLHSGYVIWSNADEIDEKRTIIESVIKELQVAKVFSPEHHTYKELAEFAYEKGISEHEYHQSGLRARISLDLYQDIRDYDTNVFRIVGERGYLKFKELGRLVLRSKGEYYTPSSSSIYQKTLGTYKSLLSLYLDVLKEISNEFTLNAVNKETIDNITYSQFGTNMYNIENKFNLTCPLTIYYIVGSNKAMDKSLSFFKPKEGSGVYITYS